MRRVFGTQHAREVLADAVSQEVREASPATRAHTGLAEPGEAPPDWDYLVEVTVKPGVTDPLGQTARQALVAFLPEEVPAEARVQTATQYLILVGDSSARLDRAQLASFFYNPLIQSALIITCPEWQSGSRPPGRLPAGRERELPRCARSWTLPGLAMKSLLLSPAAASLRCLFRR